MRARQWGRRSIPFFGRRRRRRQRQRRRRLSRLAVRAAVASAKRGEFLLVWHLAHHLLAQLACRCPPFSSPSLLSRGVSLVWCLAAWANSRPFRTSPFSCHSSTSQSTRVVLSITRQWPFGKGASLSGTFGSAASESPRQVCHRYHSATAPRSWHPTAPWLHSCLITTTSTCRLACSRRRAFCMMSQHAYNRYSRTPRQRAEKQAWQAWRMTWQRCRPACTSSRLRGC